MTLDRSSLLPPEDYIVYGLIIFSYNFKFKKNCVYVDVYIVFFREAVKRLIYCSTILMWVMYNQFVTISEVKIWGEIRLLLQT
jgi:hypothetical protein